MVGVSLGTGVDVGVSVGTWVGVSVAVLVAVGSGVTVGVALAVAVGWSRVSLTGFEVEITFPFSSTVRAATTIASEIAFDDSKSTATLQSPRLFASASPITRSSMSSCTFLPLGAVPKSS